MKPLSDKQKDAFINSTARINILEGAVRSGKSFVCILRWIDFCINGPAGALVLCGRTDKTIKRNLIMPMQNLLGNAVQYRAGKGEVQLYGRTMFVVGANDERAEGKIRGSEFAGALIDEATLMPENFFKMLLSRMSIPGACVFASTNPDSPYHWLKRDFIDRAHEIDIKNFKFTIRDNPSLSETYIRAISEEYRGLWYKRFILGEWVIAEGTVYDFFDESRHVIPYVQSPAEYYIIGIDYGTTNPCVFTLLGYNSSAYPNMWIEKEYYFDSRKEQRQKSDYDYVKDYIKFVDGFYVKYIYIDPSAASLKQEFLRNGISNFVDAKNDVVPGIRYLGQLITNGTLKICATCKETIKEFSTYAWDEKAATKGEDKPLKVNDHCFVAGSLVSTKWGTCPIEKLEIGDEVLTPIGYKKIVDIFVHDDKVADFYIFGTKVRCTPHHKIYTANRGWIEVRDFTPFDTILKVNEDICLKKNRSFLKVSDLEGTHTVKIEPLESILAHLSQTKKKDIKLCTEKSGKILMGKSQRECIYITSTLIPLTMTLVTSAYSLPKTIVEFIKTTIHKNKKKNKSITYILLGILQKLGIVPMPDNYGMENMMDQNFVRISVSLNGEETITLTMSLDYALSVVNNIDVTNTESPSVAVCHVDANTIEKVYNLHVEDCHCYFVNSLLVLNCMDSIRYSTYTHFYNRSTKRMTEQDAIDLERTFGKR